MKITALKNIVVGSKIIAAGESTNLPDAEAKELVAAELAEKFSAAEPEGAGEKTKK
jgi:hypothetical protein